MIRRRAAATGIAAPNWLPHVPRHRDHRLPNGGALEHAQEMAAHESRARPSATIARRSGLRRTKWKGSGCEAGALAIGPLKVRLAGGERGSNPTVASYALRGDGLIFTTFDGGLDLSRRNASATLSASWAKRYGFWRTRSPSAGENAEMSA